MVEAKCKKCGRVFIPAPYHIYVDRDNMYCGWTCFLHRKEKKQQKKYKAVVMTSEDGKQTREFTSVTHAVEFTGYCVNNIRKACKDGKPYNGFIWKYKE